MHDGWQHLPPQVKAPLEQGNRQAGAEGANQIPDEVAGRCNALLRLHMQVHICQPYGNMAQLIGVLLAAAQLQCPGSTVEVYCWI